MSVREALYQGHRIWVSLILDLFASGMTTRGLRDEYPGPEEANIFRNR
jgi:uncharacterized protein (DUF433 family)